MIKILSRDKFIKNKIYFPRENATHLRIEGSDIVGYACNPHPGYGMLEIPSMARENGLIAKETVVGRRIFSRILEMVGMENPTTFHYQA